jgi:uncharacterized membrane-anchored protein
VPTSDISQPAPVVPVRHALRKASEGRLLRKVPEATIYFWIIKVLTTGMGEAASDFQFHRFGLIFAVGVSGVGLAIALALQFFARAYVPWIYWLAVAMVSVFGTLVADGMRVGLGISYLTSTVSFVIVLIVIFAVWYASERTLSIHTIDTRRREFFYWATVMATFALGTAAGDMTARTLGLGYLASGVMFAVVIAIPAVAHLRFGLNAISAFWLAYIVTRPLGASFADWAAAPQQTGGLGLGFGLISGALTVLIVGFVAYLTVTRRDVEPAR